MTNFGSSGSRPSVFQRDCAVQLQRDRDPLILFDAAVVVRFEVAQLVLLVERDLLEVETGRVDMRAGDHRAVGQALFADHGQQQRLAAIVDIELRAGLQLHAEAVLDEALLFRQRDGVVHRLALDAGAVQIVHVAPAVVLHREALLGADQVIAVFLLVEKLLSQFIHASYPPKIDFCRETKMLPRCYRYAARRCNGIQRKNRTAGRRSAVRPARG